MCALAHGDLTLRVASAYPFPTMRSLVVLVALALPGLAAGQPAPAQPTAPKVLVFPFAAIGDEARVSAELFRKNLINQIDLLPEVDSLDPAKAEASLGKPLAEARDGCSEDDVCMTALARAVGARYLVKGGLLVNAEKKYTLSLQGFDADLGTTFRKPDSKQVANEDAGVESMRLAAAWLFAKNTLLSLQCDVPGAAIFIDSLPIGARTPLQRPLPVSIGKISVRVEAAGYEPFATTLETRAGVTNTLKAVLKRKPQPIAVKPRATPAAGTPITSKPLFWGAVGAGVAVLAGGIAIASSQGGDGKTKREYDDENSNLPPSTTIAW